MLQVFQMQVASVCSKCFICFQTYVAIVFYLDVAYVSHICCNSMFHNVSAILCLMLQQVVSCCKLQVLFFLDVSWVPHTYCKCMYKSSFFQTYVAFKFFHVASVSCCLARASCGQADGVGGRCRGRTDGCSTRGHAGSRLSSVARAVREERVWRITKGRRYRPECTCGVGPSQMRSDGGLRFRVVALLQRA
jgi:hypothetical protein